jgi:hypothetical protein
MVMVLEPFTYPQLWQNHFQLVMVLLVGRGGGVFKVQGIECMVMVLEPFPYPQLWQNHSPADDGLMGGEKGRCVQGSRFRMNGNSTGTLSLSSALAKPFSSW